ncbi:MAG: formylglycine-generating enzyme family protein [Kiritimatiellae bacterium]|nr:formylglycine-generating enzyme family protein [Kiritimatiellia bacterium]
MLQKDGRFLDVETVHLKARSNLVIFLMILLLFALNVNGDYIIIDVSGGTDVKSYPVSRLDAPPLGGWPAEYKTDKIVLARIQAGTFVRRKAIAEYPFISTNANDSYSIVVSRPYYIGVFPVTQRQWEHVLGTRPSSFRNDTDYAMRPVESVSYTMVRGDTKGTGYPHSVDVDDNSFIGVLRKKAGLTSLDIPTEDQWECACHAGKTAQYGNGDDSPVSMLDLGRYAENSGGGSVSKVSSAALGTSEVGKYTPNGWGIYDMQGGVWEWCLDAVDPIHAPARRSPLSLDVDRVLRGGYWGSSSPFCAASVRSARSGSVGWDCSGVRLALTDSSEK